VECKRILQHPVLEIPRGEQVPFTWNGEELQGREGEALSSALFANGVQVFGHHEKDGSPQGLFCANGQCSQCLVMADGLPVKSCMVPLTPGVQVESVEGLPTIPIEDRPPAFQDIPTREVSVLIIGGGPAGLSAALELGKLGVETLLVDDKDRLGGKLVLQTHKFFGSVEDSYAGTRGFEIGRLLEEQVAARPSVEVWLNTTAVGVFSDQIVAVVREGRYQLIRPQKLLVATGAREKMLPFPGNTLPGVYGAGAFQTLVNRDLVKCSEKVLVVGGGNVGVIAGYHALQAGIEVVALIEGAPKVGGYKVHADKLVRLGVPIFTRHTVLSAQGKERVESVTIAEIDENWKPIQGTEKTFAVDTVLIAVGLNKVDEFVTKAREWGMDVYAAGDAQEIAEASAAMFTGKIEGLRIARSLAVYPGEIPDTWIEKAKVLKSRPGLSREETLPEEEQGVVPVLHCNQEIPCNPCTSICDQNVIHIEDDDLTGIPHIVDSELCQGCLKCVAVCPGLAITLVDYRKDASFPSVTLPYEFASEEVHKGTRVRVTDVAGEVLGEYPVQRVVKNKKQFPGTLLLRIQMEKDLAKRAVGIQVQSQPLQTESVPDTSGIADEAVICRCERITAGEIRAAIRDGVRDLNHLKAINRTGMGACGAKTCRTLVWGIFRDEGVDLKETTDRIDRPLFVEVPLGTLAGIE
jgi:NADPH-dependent 2,4-dienoyl-CoA reductase/sulfur reductase-like enzyme/Fe-S-cluster-containing hydrogenase component 2/bacterioferritin-associated ferredoxin